MILVNCVIADVTLNLMLHNMSRRKYSPVINPSILYLLIPICVIVLCGLDGVAELYLIRFFTLLSFCSFYFRMAVLGRQYCDFSGRSFWFRPMPIEATSTGDKKA